MKKSFFIITCLFSSIYIFSQEKISQDSISEAEFENFLGKSFLQAKAKNLDEATVNACGCISKAALLRNEKSRAVATKKCIENQVFAFQFISKLADAANLPDSAENSAYKLRLSRNKKASEYRKYYDEIEKNLIKQCDSTVLMMIRTTTIDFNALSENPDALKAYKKAEQYVKLDKWKKAAKNYEKAVSIDENFAVAWEKLGLSYRHINKNDKATAAYNRAKEIRKKMLLK